jgi:hypothetical protein
MKIHTAALLVLALLAPVLYPLGDVTGDCRVDVYDVELVDHGLLYPDIFPALDVDGDGDSDLGDLYTTIESQGLGRCRWSRLQLLKMHAKERHALRLQ